MKVIYFKPSKNDDEEQKINIDEVVKICEK